MRPVLLVIDMQEHFRAGMAEKVLQPLNALIDACRALRVPVIWTQHGHQGLDRPAEAEAASVLVKCYGLRAWQLLPELHRQPGDHVIASKRTYDAFQGTELLSLLERHGCDTLLVAGVMTNLCCETTARSAFCKNLNVLFLSDGTATASAAMHDASLSNLAYGFARVFTCAEAAAGLQRELGGGGCSGDDGG